MLDSQPRPAYSTPRRPNPTAAPAAFSIVSREIWLSPSPIIPGKTSAIASTVASRASGKTPAIQPTAANASARIGKNERKPKYVTAPACCPAFTAE